MTKPEAMAFVRRHGVVLESATGPVPSLAEAIVGEAVGGSWWAHPRGREIFQLTRAARASSQLLVCRLVDGKVTYVHRRLWPALVRLQKRFPRKRLARIREVHTESGRHVIREVAFPKWVPVETAAAASRLDDAGAVSALGTWCS